MKKQNIKKIIKSKKKYHSRKMSFEEKIHIMAQLQEKAYFFGKTKLPPWGKC